MAGVEGGRVRRGELASIPAIMSGQVPIVNFFALLSPPCPSCAHPHVQTGLHCMARRRVWGFVGVGGTF